MERNPWWQQIDAAACPAWDGKPVGVKPDGGGSVRGQGLIGKMLLHRAAHNRDAKRESRSQRQIGVDASSLSGAARPARTSTRRLRAQHCRHPGAGSGGRGRERGGGGRQHAAARRRLPGLGRGRRALDQAGRQGALSCVQADARVRCQRGKSKEGLGAQQPPPPARHALSTLCVPGVQRDEARHTTPRRAAPRPPCAGGRQQQRRRPALAHGAVHGQRGRHAQAGKGAARPPGDAAPWHVQSEKVGPR